MTVNKILAVDKLLITKEGLNQLLQSLVDRQYLRFKTKNIKRELLNSEIEKARALGIERKAEELPKYDPAKPLKFKFKILEDYLKDYEKVQSDNSSLNESYQELNKESNKFK